MRPGRASYGLQPSRDREVLEEDLAKAPVDLYSDTHDVGLSTDHVDLATEFDWDRPPESV